MKLRGTRGGRGIRASAAAFLVASAWSSVTRAQSRDPAAAEALFDEGRRMMLEQRYAEACGKLEASQKLDPGVGTLLNLGDCLEKAGQLASAWARFREAASAALVAGQPGREQEARSRASALEPRLTRLVLRRATNALPVETGLVVRRDDVVVDTASWGLPLPIDSGPHTITASAPGYRAWSLRLDIGLSDAGTTPTVDVPSLAPIAVTPAPDVTTSPPRSRWTIQRTLGVALGGAAVLAFGASGILAFRAKQLDDEAQSRCDASGCGASARDDARRAGSLADGATVALVAGGVLAVSALVVYVTAPSARRGNAAAPVARRAPTGLVFAF